MLLKNCDKLNACKYEDFDNRFKSVILLLPPNKNEFSQEGNSKDSPEACDIKQLKCYVI